MRKSFIVFCFFSLFARPLPLWICVIFDFLINKTRNLDFYPKKRKKLTPNFAKICPGIVDQPFRSILQQGPRQQPKLPRPQAWPASNFPLTTFPSVTFSPQPKEALFYLVNLHIPLSERHFVHSSCYINRQKVGLIFSQTLNTYLFFACVVNLGTYMRGFRCMATINVLFSRL